MNGGTVAGLQSSGEDATTATTATAIALPVEEPLVEDGLTFFQQWAFDAQHNGVEIETFRKHTKLTLDVQWLEALGVDAQRLAL